MSDWRVTARPQLERALRAKDQDGFTFMLVLLAGSIPTQELNDFATELLAEQDHDIQTWWMGECNCDGHQN